jgi:uracil DNA glycosylase superfamily protein
MTPARFIEQLSAISFRSVFNPYRDACCQHDHSDSPAIRRMNLQRYMEATVFSGVDSIWLGRDCGYRGARRTGIALTDELHLTAVENHFGISGLAKATVGNVMKERTATEVWKVMLGVKAKAFLWNVFPFHPFEEDNPMSNRRHTAGEFTQCSELLVVLLEWLQPQTIVALGADACSAVQRLGFPVSLVRHPSYGGQTAFAAGIRALYRGAADTTPNAS